MSYLDGWRASVEDRFRDAREVVAKLTARVARLEGMLSLAAARSPQGGGGSKLWVGEVASAISAGSTGTFQPYSTAGGGWTLDGDTFAVRNLGGAIATGKKCAAQADQSGTMIVSPLQC